MKELEVKIDGMSCDHCVKAIENELSELNLDFYEVEIGSAVVKYDEAGINEDQIYNAINEAGFSIMNG